MFRRSTRPAGVVHPLQEACHVMLNLLSSGGESIILRSGRSHSCLRERGQCGYASEFRLESSLQQIALELSSMRFDTSRETLQNMLLFFVAHQIRCRNSAKHSGSSLEGSRKDAQTAIVRHRVASARGAFDTIV
jgi:hypothetical protein